MNRLPSAASVPLVFPSAAVLPENLLRFHVFFQRPPFVDAMPHAVRLLDSTGAQIAHPFLDLQHGLWDGTGKRLTLLLHPGRIKSGLASHAALGSAIRGSQRFQLALDLGALVDDLAPGVRVQTFDFGVDKPVATAFTASVWGKAPAIGTGEPLHLAFDRSMDRLGLEQAFAVSAPDGRAIPVDLDIAQAESQISLRPRTPWLHSMCRIRIAHDLEDVSGNRQTGAFEQQCPEQNTRRSTRPTESDTAGFVLPVQLRNQ
jgi:hypothetical protein